MRVLPAESVKEEPVDEEQNKCIIEYDEKNLGHAVVNKVYTGDGVDISIRFVKQKLMHNGRLYDPDKCPEGIQRLTVMI